MVEKISEEKKNKELMVQIRELECAFGRKQLELDYYKEVISIINEEDGEDVVINNRQHKSRSGLRVIYHKEKMFSLLGINQFEKEMSSRGYALQAYKSYIKTTDSRGKHYLFDNLIEGIEINRESQVIV